MNDAAKPEAMERCADVIRSVMHEWARHDRRRLAYGLLGDYEGADREREQAEHQWRRVRPALKRLLEEVTEP